MLSKSPVIKSKKIRASAKGETCTVRHVGGCASDDTVVFAHLNSRWKGVGNKSPDLFGVFACQFCHQRLDSGDVDFEDQLRALQETQLRLYQKGLIKVE